MPTPPNGKQLLCRGIFFHMLGLDNDAMTALAVVKTDKCSAYSTLAQTLTEYINTNVKKSKDKIELLQTMIRKLGDILDPQKEELPNLSLECPAPENPRTGAGKACDNPTAGFSRNPFKRIEEQHVDDIALAISCYLLRGYALFFLRSKNRRDFNAAKTALNDFHQVYILAWRLYHTSGFSHYDPNNHNLESFLFNVKNWSTISEQPGTSAYFIWYSLVLSEIMRANIYRQIDHLEEADKHYRRAQKRFNQLCRHIGGLGKLSTISELPYIVTPTLLHALFERSKVRFDLGQFLESLMTQTRCLYFLVIIWQHNNQGNAAIPASTDLMITLDNIFCFLDVERTLPIYDREAVTRYFGYGAVITNPAAKHMTYFEPCQLIPFIPPPFAQFACELLARMGFTLYVLRPRMIPRNCWTPQEIEDNDKIGNNHGKWLRPYFRFEEIWNPKNSRKHRIRPSHLGTYSNTLVNTERGAQNMFQNDIERKFALILRQVLGNPHFEGKPLDEKLYYKAILATTTQNIVNIVTIPRRNRRVLMRHGYKYRRTRGDLSTNTVAGGIELPQKHDEPPKGVPIDKFVVLRRWQSFNPKIPRRRGRRLPGGGYFLFWRGKGIVIDPGYDFIQNFYDEGFSLEDIDAIIVTHSHPDHDDDLSSLTTLIKEWNDFHVKIGRSDREKYIDVFLNESAHWKFASWLQASDVRVGRVISLPIVCWRKNTGSPSEGPIRGKNIRLDLRTPCTDPKGLEKLDVYNMVIEVVPAWHDDVIGKTAAVGLKFHLYLPDGTRSCIVGYTGDTGAYGFDISTIKDPEDTWRIDHQYRNCDVLIAHLGDIRIRELSTAMKWHDLNKPDNLPLIRLLKQWFPQKWASRASDEEFRDRVLDLLNFANSLDIFPSSALKAVVKGVTTTGGKVISQPIHKWFNEYLKGGPCADFPIEERNEAIMEPFKSIYGDDPRTNKHLAGILSTAYNYVETTFTDPTRQRAIDLLYFLMVCAAVPWQYDYHLGMFGIYKLFEAVVDHQKKNSKKSRIFVVGELPEELASYRHMVAHWLNMTSTNRTSNPRDRHVHAFTGDIGLHIGLYAEGKFKEPRIRCTYCNYNNETVCHKDNYQHPSDILETPIKRQDSAMIYLCTKKDHHPECPDEPKHFLGSPYLRVI